MCGNGDGTGGYVRVRDDQRGGRRPVRLVRSVVRYLNDIITEAEQATQTVNETRAIGVSLTIC